MQDIFGTVYVLVQAKKFSFKFHESPTLLAVYFSRDGEFLFYAF